jgi:hypothetical protein
MSAAALIQVALALLPLIQTGVGEFILWINSLRAAAQQSGEWTPAQEADFRAKLLAKTGDPAYAPDP